MSTSPFQIHYDHPEGAPIPVPPTPPKAPLPHPRPSGKQPQGWFRRVPMFASGFAAVALVAVLAFVVVREGVLFPGKTVLSAIAIPAAHAGDAFDVVPLSADAGGMDAASAWKVTSKIDVSADQLKQALRILPDVDVKVQKTSAGEYQIEPANELERGKVYRVSIATAIETPDGTKAREFSWAFQTKADFQLLTSIPGDKTSHVPLNTGIEFTFTRDGFGDAAPFFTITPAVKGRFEVRGRTLTFVPTEALKPGTRYDVVLRKGFGIKGSDLALQEDVELRFETTSSDAVQPGQPTATRLGHNEFFDVRPKQAVSLHVFRDQLAKTSSDVEVQIYRLTKESGRKLLAEHLSIPYWMPALRSRDLAFEQAEKTQIASIATKLESDGNGWNDLLTLPAFADPGLYAVRLLPRVPGGRPSWVFYQATDAAVYVMGDDTKLVVWAVNAGTQKPLGNMPVTLGSESAKTNDRGLAEVPTPDFLKLGADLQEEEDEPVTMLEVGEGALSVFVPVRRNVYAFDFGWESISHTWSYTYIDRPLYRPADELFVWGIARDRETGDRVPTVTASIQGVGSQELTTDQAGRFETRFTWDDLAPGYYSMSIKRGDENLHTVSFEVRVFAKPTYWIDVTPERERYMDGEEVVMKVKAAFFDGTPLVNGRLGLEWSGMYGNQHLGSNVVTLDAFGEARVRLDTKGKNLFAPCYQPVSSELDEYNQRCTDAQGITATLRPTEGEEGQISGSASVSVFGSMVALQASGRSRDTEAEATVRTFRRTNDPTDEDGLAEAIPNQSVTLTIQPTWYERTQTGTGYDSVEKKTYPIYRYDRRTDTPSVVQVITDAQGRARHVFQMRKDRWYIVTYESKDEAGRVTRATRSFYPGPRDWYENPSFEERAYPRLELEPSDPEAPGYSVGDQVTATYYVGKERLQADKTPGVLFVVGSRGIKEVAVEAQGSRQITFSENLLPNAEVFGVTWRNGTFEVAQASLSFNKEDRALEVEVTPERTSYAPGERVTLRVKAKRARDGRAAAGERMAFAAVDKALLAVTYSREEYPLLNYYAYVPSGIRHQFRTHSTDFFGGGGAEKGGGGGDSAGALRRSFKDTAAAGSIELDGNGEGLITFVAPDNLTSWRVQVTGVTSRGDAGAAVVDVAVTKSVFVDVVLPPTVTIKDKPTIKLRAFGTALPQGTAVTYRVSAPTLGIQDQKLNGKAGEPLTVAVDTLLPGIHKIAVRLETPSGRDGVERTMKVVDSYVTRRERVAVDAMPGTTLPALNTSQVQLQITSNGRSSLLPLLFEADWQSRVSARLDAKVAEHVIKKVAPLFDQGLLSDERSEVAWSDYQSGDGGLRLLPYASTDAALSSRIAAVAPELINRGSLGAYLYNLLAGKSSSRETQLEALAGLAALGEPVLPSLQAATEIKDLSWRERLSLARGLDAAGDRERSGSVLEPLLKLQRTRDDLAWIEVSDRQAERLEASAEIAALLAVRGDERADALMAYVSNAWADEAFPILAKAQYLKLVAPTLPDREIHLTYAIGDKRTDVTLKRGEGAADPVALTEAEAREFRVISVDGPVEISLIREASGRPTNVPEVQVNRSYQTDKSMSELMEGDTVRVNLRVTWSPAAQPGCYTVRDFVPGGLTPIVNWTWDWYSYGVFPTDVGEGTISFYTCGSYPATITYLTRVVSRGSYVAEAPIVQHMEHPSIAASGKEETIIVK